jgi:erythronate-4-phosphate dehydrogenase
MKKIIIDKNIPYIQGVLEPYFNVEYSSGDDICREMIQDASALIIRTRTKCNRELLQGSSVELICTATIGTDHIDSKACDQMGISYTSAPGCNSRAVMEYVFTAINQISKIKNIPLINKRIGVIGAGNVGSKVIAQGREMGFDVIFNDIDNRDGSTPLPELLKRSDIVTLHIPLENNISFAKENFFDAMRDDAIFVNASRGEVVDEMALLRNKDKFGGIVIDTWCNEPNISRALLSVADIATPHIAGYSIEGKINATVAVVKSIGEKFDIDELKRFNISYNKLPFDIERYDIMADDAALRAAPENFEKLRSNYKYRQ